VGQPADGHSKTMGGLWFAMILVVVIIGLIVSLRSSRRK
jgi:hypothetical protein